MGQCYIVTVGVGEFDLPALNLPAVADDVRRVSEWFEKHPHVAHLRALPTLADNPRWQDITESLATWLAQLGPDDSVVIFIASHGEQEGSRAYLLGRNSPRAKVAGQAIEAVEFGRMIGQYRAHNVLLIIDACVAGELGAHIQLGIATAAIEHNSLGPRRDWVHVVLCSTYGRDSAEDGAFVTALLGVLQRERWTGTKQRLVGLEQVMRGLREEAHQWGLVQIPQRYVSGPGSTDVFPNANYDLRPDQRLFESEELSAHFDPVSRGVPRGHAGSFFKGRQGELARMAQWLRQPIGGGLSLLVVTGPPGSGKSALLARAVMLSRGVALPSADDPVFPKDAFDKVLWCHNKSMRQLTRELGASMGSSVDTPAALLQALRSRTELNLTIAIDSLDEAVQPEATDIASQLIVPLSRTPGVRVVVATRQHPIREGRSKTDLLEDLQATAEQLLRLGTEADNKAELRDLKDYVKALLSNGEAPAARHWRAHPDEAEQVAERIAEAARPSFLVGAISARTFAAAEKVPSEGQALRLPQEAGEALGQYIDRLSRPDAFRILLCPLAWALGGGLAWGSLWPPLASAFAGQDGANGFGDGDIKAMLDEAGDLVVENIEHGEPVYRLFHEALAEHLRGDLSPAIAHARFADVLLALAPRDSLIEAPPYALGHLPRHLALAGKLETLVELSTDPLWERAKRYQYDDPMAWAADVDLALQTIADADPGDLRIVGCCAVYSRMIAAVPPVVVEVFARAGQTSRAEMLANNINMATARVNAYCRLARVHAEQGDRDAAERCLDEAIRCSEPVAASHRSMSLAQIALAAHAAGFESRAVSSTTSATDMALRLAQDLRDGGDSWDLSNALFWAGLAARRLGREDLRGLLRTSLRQDETSFRNQTLQAASVIGDHDFLRLQFKSLMTAGLGVGNSSIRAGSLALALQDAGLSEEFEKLRGALVGQGQRAQGEPDAQKRYTWALALAGHFDEAIANASSIAVPGERYKALARVAQTARAAEPVEVRTQTMEKLGKLAAEAQPTISPDDELELLALQLSTGQLEPALVVAEDLVRTDSRTLDVLSRRLEPRRKMKTAKRPLEEDTAEANDEAEVVLCLQYLRNRKFHLAAKAAAKIRLPVRRAEALLHVALASPKPEGRLRRWLLALRAARLAGRHVFTSIFENGNDIVAKARGEETWKGLLAEINGLDQRWSFEEFAEHYEALRASLAPGDQRTRHMTALMSLPRRSANEVAWKPHHLRRQWDTGQDGKRLYVLGLMQGNSDLEDASLIAEAITQSRSAFEQFQALKIVWDDIEAIALGDAWRRNALAAALRAVLQRHEGTSRGDRHHLGADRLKLARLATEALGV